MKVPPLNTPSPVPGGSDRTFVAPAQDPAFDEVVDTYVAPSGSAPLNRHQAVVAGLLHRLTDRVPPAVRDMEGYSDCAADVLAGFVEYGEQRGHAYFGQATEVELQMLADHVSFGVLRRLHCDPPDPQKMDGAATSGSPEFVTEARTFGAFRYELERVREALEAVGQIDRWPQIARAVMMAGSIVGMVRRYEGQDVGFFTVTLDVKDVMRRSRDAGAVAFFELNRSKLEDAFPGVDHSTWNLVEALVHCVKQGGAFGMDELAAPTQFSPSVERVRQAMRNADDMLSYLVMRAFARADVRKALPAHIVAVAFPQQDGVDKDVLEREGSLDDRLQASENAWARRMLAAAQVPEDAQDDLTDRQRCVLAQLVRMCMRIPTAYTSAPLDEVDLGGSTIWNILGGEQSKLVSDGLRGYLDTIGRFHSQGTHLAKCLGGMYSGKGAGRQGSVLEVARRLAAAFEKVPRDTEYVFVDADPRGDPPEDISAVVVSHRVGDRNIAVLSLYPVPELPSSEILEARTADFLEQIQGGHGRAHPATLHLERGDAERAALALSGAPPKATSVIAEMLARLGLDGFFGDEGEWNRDTVMTSVCQPLTWDFDDGRVTTPALFPSSDHPVLAEQWEALLSLVTGMREAYARYRQVGHGVEKAKQELNRLGALRDLVGRATSLIGIPGRSMDELILTTQAARELTAEEGETDLVWAHQHYEGFLRWACGQISATVSTIGVLREQDAVTEAVTDLVTKFGQRYAAMHLDWLEHCHPELQIALPEGETAEGVVARTINYVGLLDTAREVGDVLPAAREAAAREDARISASQKRRRGVLAGGTLLSALAAVAPQVAEGMGHDLGPWVKIGAPSAAATLTVLASALMNDEDAEANPHRDVVRGRFAGVSAVLLPLGLGQAA